MSDTDDLIAAEAARLRAICTADGAALLALLDPRFRYTHANGRSDTRDSLVTRVASGQPRHHSPVITVEEVTLLGTTAVTRGQIGFTLDLASGPLHLDNLFQAVWTKESGGWQQIALQTTARPQPPKPLETMIAPAAPLEPALQSLREAQAAAGLADLFTGRSGPEARARSAEARARFYPPVPLPSGKVEEITIPGPAGPIPARIIRPLSGPVRGTILYLHGGGWAVGDLESHHPHAVRIANRTGSVVVNLGYRLAPEHRFPAAVEDAWAGLLWARDNLARLGQDASRLAVAGDSAGGGLAAVLAILARDAGLPLAAQLLIYPSVDLVDTPHYAPRNYLGPDFAQLWHDFRVSPLRAPSHRGLAPAVIGIGHHDHLHPANIAYAKALHAAGTPVILREFPSLDHGFFSKISVTDACREAADTLCSDLRSLLA